jgi:molybdopterin-biosynthesis enzyme MoeA-like protein
VHWARSRADHVFTSGGIGPTHDDVTVRAVALALGRRVIRLPEIEIRVREHYGDKLTPEALRLADAPEGAKLLQQPGVWYPVLACEGMYLLPGVPQLFRMQLDTVLGRMDSVPNVLRCMYLLVGEAEIAGALDEVALAMPDVAIGSYPLFGQELEYRVKVTVEHAERDRVDGAVQAILLRIPREGVLRVDP